MLPHLGERIESLIASDREYRKGEGGGLLTLVASSKAKGGNGSYDAKDVM